MFGQRQPSTPILQNMLLSLWISPNRELSIGARSALRLTQTKPSPVCTDTSVVRPIFHPKRFPSLMSILCCLAKNGRGVRAYICTHVIAARFVYAHPLSPSNFVTSCLLSVRLSCRSLLSLLTLHGFALLALICLNGIVGRDIWL